MAVHVAVEVALYYGIGPNSDFVCWLLGVDACVCASMCVCECARLYACVCVCVCTCMCVLLEANRPGITIEISCDTCGSFLAGSL